jgi:hypothetical protein
MVIYFFFNQWGTRSKSHMPTWFNKWETKEKENLISSPHHMPMYLTQPKKNLKVWVS